MTTDRSSGAGDAPHRPSARSSRPPRSRTTGASSSTSSSELTVGRVGRPHGLDGSFYVVEASEDLPAVDGFVVVRGVRRRIERRAGSEEKPILRLEGAAAREDAEALRGAELRAEVILSEDEFWAHDLAGC